jgi:hypothetical protein
MYCTHPQSLSVTSVLPATANVTVVQVSHLSERPAPTPLLQFVHSKALYKAAEVAATHVGPRS